MQQCQGMPKYGCLDYCWPKILFVLLVANEVPQKELKQIAIRTTQFKVMSRLNELIKFRWKINLYTLFERGAFFRLNIFSISTAINTMVDRATAIPNSVSVSASVRKTGCSQGT